MNIEDYEMDTVMYICGGKRHIVMNPDGKYLGEYWDFDNVEAIVNDMHFKVNRIDVFEDFLKINDLIRINYLDINYLKIGEEEVYNMEAGLGIGMRNARDIKRKIKELQEFIDYSSLDSNETEVYQAEINMLRWVLDE